MSKAKDECPKKGEEREHNIATHEWRWIFYYIAPSIGFLHVWMKFLGLEVSSKEVALLAMGCALLTCGFVNASSKPSSWFSLFAGAFCVALASSALLGFAKAYGWGAMVTTILLLVVFLLLATDKTDRLIVFLTLGAIHQCFYAG